MSVVKKQAIGDGVYNEWQTRLFADNWYGEIDDGTAVASNDGDSTFIRTHYATNDLCSFIFSTTGALVPSGATDIYVELHCVIKSSDSSKNARFRIYNDGTLGTSSAIVSQVVYYEQDGRFDRCPISGGDTAWTIDLVNSTAWEGVIQEGVNNAGGFVWVVVTEMWAEVYYTPYVEPGESSAYRLFTVHGRELLDRDINFILSGKEESNVSRSFIIDGKTETYWSIFGHIYDSNGTGLVGQTIAVNESGSVYSTVTGIGGGYQITVPESHVEVVPSYNDWDYLPRHTSFSLTEDTTGINFTQSSASRWWDYDSATGQGRHFAFRNKINFSTPHGYYREGDIVNYPIQTGYQYKLCSDADFGEAIQHSGTQIYYQDGYTYIAYRNAYSLTRLFQLTRPENIWSSVTLGPCDIDGNFTSDSHYYPAVICNDDGYIYVILNSHNNEDYVKYYRSDNPHDISSFTSGTFYAPKTTYIRAVKNPVNGDIFLFYRQYAGNVAYTPFPHWSFSYSKSSGTGFSVPRTFACVYETSSFAQGEDQPYYFFDGSIYCGGVQIDSSGKGYIILDYHWGYGGQANTRWDYSVNFVYSPDLTITTPLWYDIHGTLVATTNFETVSRGFVSVNEATVWQVTANPGESGVHKGTNNEALCVSNNIWDNGIHSIHLPIFLYSSSNGYALGLSDYLISYFDTASLEWHTKNISKDIGLQASYARSQGRILQKPNGKYEAYLFINSSISNNNEWQSLQFIKAYCTAATPGGTWNSEIIENNQAFGSGMMSMKSPNYSGNMVEIAYCRGNYLFYYNDYEQYGYFRKDGDDCRIVYNNNEIPRVGDFWSNQETNIYFGLQKDLPELYYYDTTSNYYIYYGVQSTSLPRGVASSNPHDIWKFFESFEQYEDGTRLEDNGWAIYKSQSGDLCPYNFSIVGPNTYFTLYWAHILYYYPKAYMNYSGVKHCVVVDSADAYGTAYACTSIGRTTDSYIEGAIRKERTSLEVSNYNIVHFVGVKDGDTVYGIGKTVTFSPYRKEIYCYYNGSQWVYDSAYTNTLVHYNSEVRMFVSSVDGAFFYKCDTAGNETVFGNCSDLKYFDSVIFGCSDIGHTFDSLAQFDFLRVRPI